MVWKAMTMILRIGSNKAFTFIELMISAVILSVGLIFILQAFSSSLRATALARDTTLACLLAEDKIEELETKIDKDIGLSAQEQGSQDDLLWDYSITDVDNYFGLKMLNLKVWRKKVKKEEQLLEITTYLKGPTLK